MAIITYPLDNVDYLGDDAALFHCTRTTGIYAGDDFSFSVNGADNIVTVQPGLAWMRINRFKGLVAAMKLETNVDMGLPDPVYPRIDRVVLQYDANKNDTEIVVKSGSPSSNPRPPMRSMTEALYEIHLLEVRRDPGAVAITAKDVTDLRLDKSCCGLMAESITEVDTEAINNQFQDLLQTIEQELSDIEAGSAVELKKLKFENVRVPVSAFVADTTYQDYPYRAAVALTGVIASMTPEVMLSVEDSTSGNFAPVAEAYTGGVYIYAAQRPEAAMTIPTIICWR